MITVELGDGYVRVTPTVPPCLRHALSYYHRYRDGRRYVGEQRDVYVTEHIPLADQSIGEMLCAPPGTIWRVRETLKAYNVPHRVIDRRTPLPRIDPRKAIPYLRGYQVRPLLELLLAGGGIGKYPTGFGKTHLIGAMLRSINRDDLIARGTPLCVVAVDSKDINKKNYLSLRDILKEREVGICMSGANRFTEDIMCVTLDSLERVEPASIGVLIVDEAHSGGSETRSEKINMATKAIKWGVSASPLGRSDGSDLITESVLGPVVSTRTYQDGVECGALVPIKVFMIPSPPPRTWRADVHRDTKVRDGITRNAPMYDEIARLLRMVPDEIQTLVLAPHVENLDKLRERLPDLPVVHAETSADSLMVKGFINVPPVSAADRAEAYEKMESGEWRQCASTYVYKQGVDFPGLGLVIVPGGGGSEIVFTQIPGRASRNIDGKDYAYLVDFTRPWDKIVELPSGLANAKPKVKDGPLCRNDKERKRVYRKLGFEVIELSSIDQLPFLEGGQ